MNFLLWTKGSHESTNFYRVKQSLQKNWLVVSKKYDMRNLVNFRPKLKSHFDGLFLPKVYGVWNKKNKGVIFHDTEQWCKIWINPDLVVSKMAWGIGWTFIRALKNLKNCTLTGSFCQKHIIIQLENSREILCHDTEGCCKN